MACIWHQHAAQERVKYEFFKQKLGKPINESQELLIPLTFDFSKKEAIFIEEAKDTLEKPDYFLNRLVTKPMLYVLIQPGFQPDWKKKLSGKWCISLFRKQR